MKKKPAKKAKKIVVTTEMKVAALAITLTAALGVLNKQKHNMNLIPAIQVQKGMIVLITEMRDALASIATGK